MFDGDLVKLLWLVALSGIWGWLIGFYMGSKRARIYLEVLKEHGEATNSK